MPLLTIDPAGSRFIIPDERIRHPLIIIGPVLSGYPPVGEHASLRFGTASGLPVYVEEARQVNPNPATVRVRVMDPEVVEALLTAYPAVPVTIERPMPDLYDGPLTKREKDMIRKQRKDG